MLLLLAILGCLCAVRECGGKVGSQEESKRQGKEEEYVPDRNLSGALLLLRLRLRLGLRGGGGLAARRAEVGMLALEVPDEVVLAPERLRAARDLAHERALLVVHGRDVHFEVVAAREVCCDRESGFISVYVRGEEWDSRAVQPL